jgi:hypothetical protein
MPLVFDSAEHGTDAGHPALVVMGWPFVPKADIVGTVIDQLDAVGDLAVGPEFAGPFFRASDLHTFKHGGVAYRCATVRQGKSGSRRGLCIFYDPRAQTQVMVHSLAPSVADAMRLSEIADRRGAHPARSEPGGHGRLEPGWATTKLRWEDLPLAQQVSKSPLAHEACSFRTALAPWRPSGCGDVEPIADQVSAGSFNHAAGDPPAGSRAVS